MSELQVPPGDIQRLRTGTHLEPHAVLGCHRGRHGGQEGLVVRAMHPDATAATVRLGETSLPMTEVAAPGLFGAFFPGQAPPQQPEVTFAFADGAQWRTVDPYSFWPTLGDDDLHLFGEGRHYRVWEVMGARARQHGGRSGTAFAVWAPNAAGVAVVCDANNWDGRVWPMRLMGSSGIFELFVPGVEPGTRYQFEVRTRDGRVLRKSDPYAEAADHPPQRASIVTAHSDYAWGDGAHMAHRARADRRHEPMNVYEVHVGSFRRHGDGRPLSYRELPDVLIPHMQHFGFTHLELLPINEHPFDGSWGYQVTGFYAPTSRYGTPDDFRYLVDRCHQAGIEVIVDWVPAHFPKDDFALARFDGTALYEHADPRQGEHPDWGTLIFNYGRREVQNFLLGSALYLLDELHVDGLRVDAVASMLYLDYSRQEGEWVPNAHGGRENLDAIDFLRHLNGVVAERCPGAYTVAEESTAWGGVTAPPEHGGLGFRLKWNMGWMNDTLVYFRRDPIHRKHHQHELTFASAYEHSERYLMPLSHDEVVHGKGSLLEKMPGDRWRKFANLRTLLTYQYTRPGKKLVFMGTEFAPSVEWNFAEGLPWPDDQDVDRQAFMRFFAALGRLYLAHRPLHASDEEDGGFAFIDASDNEHSVISYLRTHRGQAGTETIVVLLNLTPEPRPSYRVGAPGPGALVTVLDSDDEAFGGSQWRGSLRADTEPVPWHGLEDSVRLDLPPLGALVMRFEESPEAGEARRFGIAGSYYTIDGQRHTTSSLTRSALVRALRGDAGHALATDGVVRAREPARAYEASAVLTRPALGLWLQLYAVRSAHNWGIGDFGDLRRLIRWAAPLGIDFIGLNPLHATPPMAQPAVPYHPSSRLFRSPLYVEVAGVPEYRAMESAGIELADLARKLRRVRDGEEVHYPSVWALKREILQACHLRLLSLPPEHPRVVSFRAFIKKGGRLLHLWGVYNAIHTALAAAAGEPSGSALPEPLRDSEAEGVSAFADAHAEEVSFHAYVQWLVDQQLGECAELCRALGMRIGLYLDLAVGSAHDGFDAWAMPGQHVAGASIGAPPDALAPQGQNWGLVPLHPGRLLADDAELYRALIRASMDHAGAVRIDHAMGIQRQFWIPHGDALPGTYVAFPRDPLLRVIAEESRSARCLVIAEDLGTVPPGFREQLAEASVLRYEVLHFARTDAQALRAVSALQADALLCLSTHDLPTFGEFWAGRDLLLRRELGVLDEAQLLGSVQSRMVDKERFATWLQHEGEPLPDGLETHPQIVLQHVHRALAASACPMLCLSLDDLSAEPRSVNVPGTTPDSGFTSFARKMAHSLESIVDDEALADHVRTVAEVQLRAHSVRRARATRVGDADEADS